MDVIHLTIRLTPRAANDAVEVVRIQGAARAVVRERLGL
jgi:hypothetical protein